MKPITLYFVFLLILFSACSQEVSTAEKLGYESDDILLILHADDLGVSHSVNQASIDAWEAGAISSASIMVPCPWLPEISTYASDNPDFDLGLHLTLTAEWNQYKWDGVASSSEIPTLLNDKMHFPPTTAEVAQNANPEEVEKELRAQIEKALSFGIKPTHLDSHMGALFTTPQLFKVYQDLGKEYKIPVFIPYGSLQSAPHLERSIQPNQIMVDHLAMFDGSVPPEQWKSQYMKIVNDLEPGLNEIIVHLAYDNDEMKAVTDGHEDFGSAWRQQDFDVMMDPEFRDLIKEKDIKLVTWREIQNVLYPD